MDEISLENFSLTCHVPSNKSLPYSSSLIQYLPPKDDMKIVQLEQKVSSFVSNLNASKHIPYISSTNPSVFFYDSVEEPFRNIHVGEDEGFLLSPLSKYFSEKK